MSEAQFEAPETTVDEQGPVLTGVALVDEIVASVDALDGVPVEDHPAVFGAAHDALRRALDGEG